MLTEADRYHACNLAESAARAAGELLLDGFRRVNRVAERLPHDLKLDLDRRCERLIGDTIRRACPGHHLVGEESGPQAGEPDCPFVWYVDPLDGTANFAAGVPFFCTTLACYHRASDGERSADAMGELGRPVAGVVYAPWDDELFAGMPGLGAFLNDQPLSRLPSGGLAAGTVATSFGSRDGNIASFAGINPPLARRCFKLRALGCSALDAAYVACGRFCGAYRLGIRTWDFAAARILIEEVGGRIAAEHDGERWCILAAAPGAFEELAELAAAATPAP